MKKFLASIFAAAALTFGFSAFAPNTAEAVDIEINNQLGKKTIVSVVYFDEEQDSWIVKGWWQVQPNSFRTLKFPTHNRNHIWIHYHNEDRSWGNQKAWTVISDPFEYRLQEGCPEGRNRRQIAYNSYQIGQPGTVRINVK